MTAVARVADVGTRSMAGLAVPAVAGLHLVIGLLHVGSLDLWYDEGYTAEAVQLPLRDLLSMLTRVDVNMSAYYGLLDGWTHLFGTSPVSLRLPSLLMTTATVLLVGHLLTRWFGTVAGVVGATALGLSPFFLTVAVTARSYAMLALLTTVALAAFVEALGSTRFTPWALLAVVDLAALYASPMAALTVLTQGLYVLFIDRRFHWAQLGASAIMCLGLVPSLLYRSSSDPLSWRVPPTLGEALGVVYGTVGWRAGIAVAALALVGVVLRPRPLGGRLTAHPRSRLLLPAFLVVPTTVMFALLPWQSLFTQRYLTTFFISLTMLAAAATTTLSPRWGVAAAMVVLVSCVAGVVLRFVPQPGFIREDWSAATSRLDQVIEPGDAVVFTSPFVRVVGEYYGRSARFTRVGQPRLPATPWNVEPPDTYDALDRSDRFLDPAVIQQGLDGVRRAWLVAGSDDEALTRDTSALSDSGWRMADEERFPGLVLRLMTRPVAPS